MLAIIAIQKGRLPVLEKKKVIRQKFLKGNIQL